MADPLQSQLEAELAILAVCADPEGLHGNRLAALDRASWTCLCDLAMRTRTAPLLVRAIARSGDCTSAPEETMAELNEQARLQALGALQNGRELVAALDLLEREGLVPIVLKGVSLAYRDYPDAALRPLRDLDLLFRPEEALAAQELLLSQPDFERTPGLAQYGLEYGHQLPEIRKRETGVVIEIHHRLDTKGWSQEPQLVQSIHDNAITTRILGREVLVPCVEDNFLHLLEHATLHHMFANGPLLLADFHYLALAHGIEWERLTSRAESLGLLQALALVGRLAGEFGANWIRNLKLDLSLVSDEHVRATRRMLFANSEETERQEMLLRLSRRSNGRMGWFAALGRVFQPDPAQLSLYSGRPADSTLRWLGYPKWLASKAKIYFQGSNSPSDVAAAQQRIALSNWLQRR